MQSYVEIECQRCGAVIRAHDNQEAAARMVDHLIKAHKDKAKSWTITTKGKKKETMHVQPVRGKDAHGRTYTDYEVYYGKKEKPRPKSFFDLRVD